MANAPIYTVTGEVVLDGKVFISAPVPVTAAGLTLIAQVVGTGDGRIFKVVAGGPTEPGHARFEKTCFEPVTYYILRDGEPLEQVVVTSISMAATIDLAPIFP